MNNNNQALTPQIVASLVKDIASLSSSISYWLSIGVPGGKEDEISENIRVQAGDITESIKNMLGSSPDKAVISDIDDACNKVWEMAAFAVSAIEADADDYYEEEEEE